MIVYGDTAFEAGLGGLVAGLRARVAGLADVPEGVTGDALRGLLIEAGQVEQAAWDGAAGMTDAEAGRLGAALQGVTDASASAFCGAWEERDTAAGLRLAVGLLDGLGAVPDARVMVKVPEGFAFYGLFPEQYALAAGRWAVEHRERAGPVVVVGVRSIGTGLSAVVGATLAARGRRVRRMTVRPTGPPYERRVERASPDLAGAEWALVVDEGPGQSGSSMAAVAEWLAAGGVDAARVCFLPGHGGEPGGAGSEAVRGWWVRARRYVAALDDVRWDGRSLGEELAARTAGLGGSDAPVVRVEDVGGGLWRRRVYADAGEWPASCAPFERPKFRCARADGTAILWKFEGLAVGADGPQAEAAFRRQAGRAAGGWTPAPLATGLGFVATPWVEGRALSARDGADAATLAWVGRYAASVAGPPLSADERVQAVRRLGEMLYWNVWEALGQEVAERTRGWGGVAEDWERGHASPAYGDGRMALHEWRRMASGRLVKTDSGGHDADHTIVGRQSAAWDVAGAMTEWKLDADAARPLLRAFRDAGGVVPPGDVLTFYRLAYAAFRLGQCAMSADMLAHDGGEQARLRRAVADYAALVAGLLGEVPPDQPSPST